MASKLHSAADGARAHNLSSDGMLPDMPVLEGTPRGSFPISHSRLIELAKKVYDTRGGIDDPDLLAEDFKFAFPIIKLGKARYLEALKTFKFEETFPDLKQASYGWQVDPYEPNRVWYMIRATGTHRRTLNLGSVKFQPTNKTFRTPPQIMSYVFNDEGKVTHMTGGYVADNRIGNSDGLGGLFGIMVGVGLPYPGSLKFLLYTTFLKVLDLVNFFSLGLSNKVLKRE